MTRTTHAELRPESSETPLEAGKIKLADPFVKSTRYRSYIPFWA